jgi:death on curing protein
MPDMRYPTPMDVVALNERLLGIPGGTLSDEGKLLGALHRVQAAAHYQGADVVEQSALLLEAIALAHAFVDGNKRTAFYATRLFWRLNSITFTGDQLELAQRLEHLVADHDARGATSAALIAWLRGYLHDS